MPTEPDANVRTARLSGSWSNFGRMSAPTATVSIAVNPTLPLASEAAKVARGRVTPALADALTQLAEQVIAAHDVRTAAH